MKLLVDNNLSFKLVAEFADSFPESAHVRDTVGVEADDIMVW